VRPWFRRADVYLILQMRRVHLYFTVFNSSDMPRGANFSREELDSFLDSVEDILPLSTTQWESVVEMHLAKYPDKGRTVDSLKRKFKELHIKRIPTGDPHCQPAVRRAKQLRNAIIKLMDGCDLNSPDITPH
jgi:hypothetical protein